MSTRRTDELVPGDVLVIDGRHLRTVSEITPNGYENRAGEALVNVMYAEGPCDGWSGGNSGSPGALWTLAEQCSAGVGGDPVSGCDDLATPGTDYCPRHAEGWTR
jgi:hypothetical protein